MSPNAATDAAILRVLNRHLRGEPHERTEITINEARHEIVSSELDLVVRDPSSPGLVAARLILTLRDSTSPDPKPPTELAAHIFTTTTEDADPSSPSQSTTVILDDGAHGTAPQTQPPHRTSTIPTHPHPSPSLKQTYTTYLQTFMSPSPAALATFLHEPVTHNRRALSATEYHGLGGPVRAAVPDVGVQVVGLLADGARGLVAARLRFGGTLAAGGQRVDIGEVVFYWFEGGRIREVVSLVDFGGVPLVGGGGGGGDGS